jgi:hypothetical protein
MTGATLPLLQLGTISGIRRGNILWPHELDETLAASHPPAMMAWAGAK